MSRIGFDWQARATIFMDGVRLRWLLPVLMSVATIHLIPAQAIAAGGAYVVDDAEVAKPGECTVQSWVSFASNGDLIATTTPSCVVNFGIPVELDPIVQRFRTNSVWSTTAGIAAKVNILPVAAGRFGIGLVGGGDWDAGNGAPADSYIYVPLTYDLTESFRININVGWQNDAVAHVNYASWGGGFEWKFAPMLTLIGELYGLSGPGDAGGTAIKPRTQVGLRVTPVKNISVDLIYGRNILGENANWLTLGLNLGL